MYADVYNFSSRKQVNVFDMDVSKLRLRQNLTLLLNYQDRVIAYSVAFLFVSKGTKNKDFKSEIEQGSMHFLP